MKGKSYKRNIFFSCCCCHFKLNIFSCRMQTVSVNINNIFYQVNSCCYDSPISMGPCFFFVFSLCFTIENQVALLLSTNQHQIRLGLWAQLLPFFFASHSLSIALLFSTHWIDFLRWINAISDFHWQCSVFTFYPPKQRFDLIWFDSIFFFLRFYFLSLSISKFRLYCE